MASRKRRSDTAIIHAASDTPSNSMKVESSLASAATPRIRVRIRRLRGVAHWSWNANDEVCGICQFAFEGTAPGVKYPGEDCPVVWGKCGHAFHLQCVSTWLAQASSRNSCPICRQAWEFGQNPVNTDNQGRTNSNPTG